jgi:DNA polymerase III delta subunit
LLRDAVGSQEMLGSNVATIESNEFSVEKLGAAAMVVPFLANRRMVIVRGLIGAAEPKPGSKRVRKGLPSAPTGLTDLLTQLPPSSDVVFVEAKLGPNNPILGALTELGTEHVTVRKFSNLGRDALVSWVRTRVEREGASIDLKAARMLAERFVFDDNQLWSMTSEINKLATYCNGRPIGPDDVQSLASGAEHSTIWDLVDSIMDKRPDMAMMALNRLADDGWTASRILSMVARQARFIAIAHELAASNVPQTQWGPHLGINSSSSYPVTKAAEQARRFTPNTVRLLYRLLLEADVAMKSGTSDELALTEMVAKATALPTMG